MVLAFSQSMAAPVTHCELYETAQALLAAARDFFERYNQTPRQVLRPWLIQPVFPGQKNNVRRSRPPSMRIVFRAGVTIRETLQSIPLTLDVPPDHLITCTSST